MTCAKGDASEESPLFTLYPVIIPYVVCIGKQRIERKKGESVEVRVPREGDMQTRSSDFGGLYMNRYPERDGVNEEIMQEE